MKAILTILFLTWAAVEAFSAPTDSPKQVVHDFAKWCRLGNHTFHLEQDSLTDIIHVFGEGQVVDTDAADPGNADPLWAVSYRAGSYVIRFESDGDMGGPEHLLTGVSVFLMEKSQTVALLPQVDGPIGFAFGNMRSSPRELEGKLGKAGLCDGAMTYRYEGHAGVRVGKEQSVQIFDVTGNLSVHFVDGHLTSIEMTHVTSS